MMKFRVAVLALCVVLLPSIRTSAQEANPDPNAGKLVDCGNEKAAIFAGSTTKDGNYAIGWTIRPKPGRKPLDWSGYKPADAESWADQYDATGYEPGDDYFLVNGVLDLRAKKFTLLPGKIAYFPDRVHDDFDVAWSGDEHGTRYASIIHNSHFETENFWMVAVDAAIVRPLTLTGAAKQAATAFVRQHAPRNYKRYQFAFSFGNTTDQPPPDGVFKGPVAMIHFDADIPRSEQKAYTGTFTVTMPKGTISHLTGKPSD